MAVKTEPVRLLLRVHEAAEMLGLSRSFVYKLMDEGSIPSVKIAGARRIPLRSLEKWVDEQAEIAREERRAA